MSLHNDIIYLNDTIKNNQIKTSREQKESEKVKNKLYQYKIELLEDLKTELYESTELHEDIKSQKVKHEIIEALLNYSIILINKDYTRAFLLEHYEKEVKKILIAQKEEEKKRQEELKRQEEIKRAYSLQVKREKQQRAETLQGISSLLLGLACLLGLPFVLIIFFIIGITKSVK